MSNKPMSVSIATNIVVPDAAGTPVNHTFVGNSNQGGIATWLEKTATHATGWWKFLLSIKDPSGSNGSRVYRQQMSLSMPVLVTEVINGVSFPKVAYTLRGNVELIMPQDSTLQNRKDFRKILEGLIASAPVKGVIEDLDHVTG